MQLEQQFEFLPGVLWKHLTDAEKLKYWFPCTIELTPRANTEVTFSGPDQRPAKGKVLEAQKPSLLAYTWDREVLRWEIARDGDGSVLRLTVTVAETHQVSSTAAGWHLTLMGLDDLLHHRDLGQNPALWQQYLQRYREELGH